MPVLRTRFRLAPARLRGPRALELLLGALSDVLPYARVSALELDHRVFRIATERFPDAIWHGLMANRAWHPKFVDHVVGSLAEPDPSRRKAEQERFLRLSQKRDARVALWGTLPYDTESTPGLLTSVVFPRMRDRACKLHVEAFADLVRARDDQAPPPLQVIMLQRQFYADQRALLTC